MTGYGTDLGMNQARTQETQSQTPAEPRAVPLSEFRSRVPRLLDACRNPESYAGRASPLTRPGPRVSNDIDPVP